MNYERRRPKRTEWRSSQPVKTEVIPIPDVIPDVFAQDQFIQSCDWNDIRNWKLWMDDPKRSAVQ